MLLHDLSTKRLATCEKKALLGPISLAFARRSRFMNSGRLSRTRPSGSHLRAI
jgi:hypothetical protein